MASSASAGALQRATSSGGSDAELAQGRAIQPLLPESAERGQGMVEYALILSLIVIVVILMVTLLGHQTQNLYSNISSSLGT